MTTNVGDIYYEISADVAPLLQGQRQADKALDSMEQHFDKTSKAAGNLDTGLSKLSSAIKGIIAAGVLREMAGLVQKYQEMAERVQMATSSQAEFEMVQRRLLTTANGTYRSLQEAQELYIRTADSLRSMNYTTNQAIDVQDSMSYAFVKNATSADRANNAIDAFSKSINTGKVAADQWETITSAIPSVINDIAAASKMTGAQVRALGAAGKLTAKQLTEGLRQSLEANTAAAAGMSNNLVDASVRIKTAITSILVAFEGQTGVIQSFTNGLIASADAMLKFGQNSSQMNGFIDATTTAALVLAGVLGSRYVGALAQSTAAKIQNITATRQQILADAQAAQASLFSANATQRKSFADKEAAISSLALAQAEYNVAKGSAAEMLAMDALITAKSRATGASLALAEAEIAQAAAQTRAAAAARVASVGIGLARGALSLIGGPAGAAMLAASAIFYFWQKSQQAKQEAVAFADGLDKLNDSMKAMSNTALRGSIADTNVAIKGQQEVISDLSSEIEDLTEKRDDYIRKGKQFATTAEQGNGMLQIAARLTDKINQKIRDRASLEEKLTSTMRTRDGAQTILNNNMLTSMGVHDNLIQKGTTLEQVQGAVAEAFGNTANEINRANQAGQNFNPKNLQVSPATAEGDKFILSLQEQNDLLKIQDERLRAVTKAGMEQAKVTDNKNQIAAAKQLAGENYDLEKAEEARKKAESEAESQGKRSATQAESVAQKLANLKQQTELTASSTQELSREQAMLRAEQSLGNAASAPQIQQARDYAAATWDAAAAIKARNATPELKENADYAQQKSQLEMLKGAKDANGVLLINQEQYNQQSEQLEASHQANLAKIRADAAVTPTQQSAGLIDPVQALANENARKLALIQQFEQQKTITEQQALALRNVANTQYEQQRIAAQWEIWRNQSTGNEALAASFNSLAGNASNALTGIITQSMTAEQALKSIGSNVLNSLINTFVQMGVEWVKSAVMGTAATTSGAAAGAAAQTAAVGTVAAVQTGALAAQTTASVAAAGTTAAAWTPAAILSSIASMGTAAAIGLGAVAGVIGANLLGKRKNGGPVSAGGLYQVGEGGMPEIYQASNGKQYMIPGDNGSVISNKDLQGGGGVTIIMENHGTPQQVTDYRSERGQNGEEVIRLWCQDFAKGGITRQTVTTYTTAASKANG